MQTVKSSEKYHGYERYMIAHKEYQTIFKKHSKSIEADKQLEILRKRNA